MTNAEREKEAIDWNPSSRLDGGEKIANRGFAKSLAIFYFRQIDAVAFLQRENIRRCADQTLFVEIFDLPVAQPLNVEGVARAEMLEPLHRLRWTDQRAGAAAHDIGLAGFLVDLA